MASLVDNNVYTNPKCQWCIKEMMDCPATPMLPTIVTIVIVLDLYSALFHCVRRLVTGVQADHIEES